MSEQDLQGAINELKNSVSLFSILADTNRQDIIMILSTSKRGMNVGAITEKLSLSRPAVSHHLKLLKDNNIIDMYKIGTESYYYLTLDKAAKQLKRISSIIDIFNIEVDKQYIEEQRKVLEAVILERKEKKMSIEPNFTLKAWYDGAIFYHVYPLGLCGAEKENNIDEVKHRFDILEQWLSHIKNIGCNAIYIGPLFESVGHGYETTDYKIVDKRLGDNDDFKRYVQKCHDLGIKVVVDGVFNHTGREFFAFKDLKQNKGNSKYKDWYCNVNFYGNNEYNDGFSYEAWRGYNVLVKLNQRNPEVKNYIFEVIKFWVEEWDIDGIRLDCADVLDLDFMKEMRSFCNNLKDDFWLMGEVIHGDYSRWVNDATLHSVTNYELHKGLYSGHNDHNYFEIAHTIRRLFDKNGGIVRNGRLYSFIDNHDVERIYNKLNNKDHLYSVYTLLYTLPGIPSIYYGSEFAIEGRKENNADYSLRPKLNLEDFANINSDNIEYKQQYIDLIEHISMLAAMREENAEFVYGEYRELLLTNRQYAFARILNNEAVIIAVNNDENEAEIYVPVPVGNTAYDIATFEDIEITNDKKVKLKIEAGKQRLIKLK